MRRLSLVFASAVLAVTPTLAFAQDDAASLGKAYPFTQSAVVGLYVQKLCKPTKIGDAEVKVLMQAASGEAVVHGVSQDRYQEILTVFQQDLLTKHARSPDQQACAALEEKATYFLGLAGKR